MNQATTKAGFGEHLRREREMRGISLDEISSATRIPTRFLNAFENEQWDRLPGGVFNRGFIRAVAHHLGLDDESLLAEYMLATGDQATASAAVVRQSAMPEPRGQWLTWVLILIVIGGIAFGGIYGWRKFAAHRRNAHPAPPIAPAPAAETPTTQNNRAIVRATNFV
jgi:cytoskeleton protein RodZ